MLAQLLHEDESPEIAQLLYKADVKHCPNGELLEYMAQKPEEAPSSM